MKTFKNKDGTEFIRIKAPKGTKAFIAVQRDEKGNIKSSMLIQLKRRKPEAPTPGQKKLYDMNVKVMEARPRDKDMAVAYAGLTAYLGEECQILYPHK